MNRKYTYITYLLGLSLLTLSIYSTRPSGYELSIYSGISEFSWLLLLVLVAISLRLSINFSSIIGSISIVPLYYILLNLPQIRGYVTYGIGDHIAHLNSIESILSYGVIGPRNLYPLIHIFLSQVSLITGLDPYNLEWVFSGLNILLIAAPLSIISDKLLIYKPKNHLSVKRISLILFCLFFPFNALHIQFYPQVFAYMFAPIICYVMIRILFTGSNTLAFEIVSIILVVAATLSHPTGYFLAIALGMSIFLIHLTNRILDLRNTGNLQMNKKRLIFPGIQITIATIFFYSWVSTFPQFEIQTFEAFLQVIGEGAQSTPAEEGPPISILIETGLKLYSDSILMLGVSVISMFLYLLTGKNRFLDLDTGVFSYLIAIFITLSSINIITYLLVGEQTFGRALSLFSPLMFTPIIGGLLFSQLTVYLSRQKMHSIFMTFVLVIFIISLAGFYYSPWIYSANWQVTQGDIESSNWLNENQKAEYCVNNYGVPKSLLSAWSMEKCSYSIVSEKLNFVSENTRLSKHGRHLEESPSKLANYRVNNNLIYDSNNTFITFK